jgi:O-antigen/teichoic acid export membrane protein
MKPASLTLAGIPLANLFHSRIAWDTGWSFVIKTSSIGLQFLTAVLLARMLGAEGYGIYAYAFALVTLLAMPAKAGLPQLVVRETARGMAASRPDLVSGVWRWSGRFTAVLSVLLAAVAWGVLWWSGERVAGVYAPTLLWALALTPLVALGNLRGAALRGLRRIVQGQFPEFLLRPGLFLALLAVVALAGGGMTAPLAMALHVAAAAVAFVVGAWMLLRFAPTAVRSARAAYEGRAWLASAIPLAFASGMQLVNHHTSILMLGIFLAPAEVGIFRVAVQTAALAAFGLQVVNSVLAPRVAEVHAHGERTGLQRLATGGARITLAFNLPLTTVFLAGGTWLLPLVFGEPFAAAYLPLVILLGGQLVNSAAGSAALLLNMTGHERETARGVAVGAGVNVVLNLLLVPPFGLFGAAAATAASLATWNILLWFAVRRRLGVDSSAFGRVAPRMV